MKSIDAVSNARGVLPRLVVTAVTVLLAAAIPRESGSADNLCVGVTNGPTLDGVVQGDNGWRGASQYVFNNGTNPISTPDGVVQVVQMFGAAYISFEVNKDPSFDNLDFIAVILKPDSNSANDRRIVIFPVVSNAGNAQVAPGGPPREVKYWKDRATFNTSPASGAQTLPTWLTNGTGGTCRNICITSSSNAVSPKTYVVELKIPISATEADGVGLPGTGTWGLYFDIVRLNGTSAMGELKWPPSAPDIGGTVPSPIAVENHTPLVGDWGTGQIAGSCPGVKVTSVATNNYPTDPDKIDPNSTNNLFTINLVNSGSANASGVTAVVKSSRFGTSTLYQPLGFPNPVPPAGPTSVSANGGTATLVYGPWDVLHDPNRATYATWSNVCSQVELNATGAGTLIANRYYYWNLHFAQTFSPFEHKAVIDTRGLELPRGATAHSFDVRVSTEDDRLTPEILREVLGARDPRVLADPKEPLEFADRSSKTGHRAGLLQILARRFPDQFEALRRGEIISTHDRVYCPFWDTTKYIEVEGKRYRLGKNLPCWGYIVFHVGEVAGWVGELRGPGVKKLNEQTYLVKVKPRGEAVVTTLIDTRKGRPPKPPR